MEQKLNTKKIFYYTRPKDEKAIIISSTLLLLALELPAALLYNYALSDIFEAFVSDNTEAASET